ncbi:MAG: M48 family metallopeptidase [Candidatus Peribacteria bacterium]|jgi:predicted metal-dependent hydrolase|nr:M48 family metallopeptidase [Candidatus Peribacteria bacterium]
MICDFPYEIIYTSNRNAYAKVDEKKNLILFSIPKRLRHDTQFLQQFFLKAEKLRKRHQSRKKIEKITSERILLFGEEVLWSEFIGQGKKVPTQATIEKKLKEILYEYAKERLDIFSQQIHTPYQHLTIRKSKARRGSCTSDQKIMLNLALVSLPREYIQYVIAHEVAHLVEKNHSANFWKVVEKLFPDYKTVRKKLKNFTMN